MNDLDSLSQLRHDIPPPSAAVLAVARGTLTDRIAAPVVVSPLRRRVPMRRRALISLAAAAAVAAGAIALTNGGDAPRDRTATGPTQHRSTTHQPALTPAGYLLDAAKHTRAAGDQPVPAGQYRYVKTHAWFAQGIDVSAEPAPGGATPQGAEPTVTWLSEQQYEMWMPADGTGTWTWRYTRPIDTKFFSASDKAYIENTFPGELVRTVETNTGTDGQFGQEKVPTTWGIPTPAWLATLPRDPEALLARLFVDVNKAGADVDKYDAAFLHIAQVLSSGIVPADLRAALYEVATKIPGVVLVDSTANLDGKTGVAVGRANATDGTRQDIIFDAAGGQFIGERMVTTRVVKMYNVPVGTAVESTAVSVDVAAKPPAG